MATFRLLNIPKNSESFLIQNNFKMVRDCGDGAAGLALAFTVGLIDNLMLSQNTIYSCYQFVDK